MLEKDKLILAGLEESLESALKKMATNNFLALPVVNNNEELKGTIMKETIYRGYVEENYKSFLEYISSKKVKDLYTEKIQIIYDNDEIEKASYLLSQMKIPYLSVINSQNEFVGILTHSSIFNAFSKIMGLGRGLKVVVDMLDVPGQLAKFTELLKEENVNIINIAIIGTTEDGYLRNLIKVETDNLDDLIVKIKNKGFRVF
jgi:acetoin utilization protein AcuB